jgi:hypothetical protein
MLYWGFEVGVEEGNCTGPGLKWTKAFMGHIEIENE